MYSVYVVYPIFRCVRHMNTRPAPRSSQRHACNTHMQTVSHSPLKSGRRTISKSIGKYADGVGMVASLWHQIVEWCAIVSFAYCTFSPPPVPSAYSARLAGPNDGDNAGNGDRWHGTDGGGAWGGPRPTHSSVPHRQSTSVIDFMICVLYRLTTAYVTIYIDDATARRRRRRRRSSNAAMRCSALRSIVSTYHLTPTPPLHPTDYVATDYGDM